MLDLVERVGNLGARVTDADRRLEPAVDRYVDVLVNRRAQNSAVLLTEVSRQVGPAAREADAVGSLGDDHRQGASSRRDTFTGEAGGSICHRLSVCPRSRLDAGWPVSIKRPTRVAVSASP